MTSSRLDRWYMLHDELAERRLSFMAAVLGSLSPAHNPSDHPPVRPTIAASDKGLAHRRRLRADVVSSETYEAMSQRKLELVDLIGSPAGRRDALIAAAR